MREFIKKLSNMTKNFKEDVPLKRPDHPSPFTKNKMFIGDEIAFKKKREQQQSNNDNI